MKLTWLVFLVPKVLKIGKQMELQFSFFYVSNMNIKLSWDTKFGGKMVIKID